jgi:ATP-dependent protease ClpP protease subunit
MRHTYNFFGEVSSFEQSAARISEFLDGMTAADTVVLRIHSVGGDVFEGSAIFNLLRQSEATVEVEVIGMAASMASIIMMAGDTVRVAANATVMIHSPMSFSFGNATEKEKEIEILKTIESSMLPLYAEKTGLSESEFSARFFDGQDHWLDAREAVELGIADEIIENEMQVTAKASTVIAYSTYHMNEEKEPEAVTEPETVTETVPEPVVIDRTAQLELENETLKKQLEKYTELEEENEELVLAMAATKNMDMFALEAVTAIAKTDRSKALEMVKKYEAPKKASAIAQVVAGITEQEPKDDRSSWTWKEYSMNAPEELARIQKETPEKFNNLVAAYVAR